MIDDTGRNKSDQSGICRTDPALIFDNPRRLLVTLKNIAPGHEVFVFNIVRGRDQSRDVDLRPRAEKYPVRINQPNMTVGTQPTLNIRSTAADYPVQGHATCGRLNEINVFVAADIEALPIDNAAICRLCNIKPGG
ncbi:MAG: hypothetical protein WCF85_06170 [Rhodospirillaceae bacterium]